jgi:hypothetical protein
LASTATYKTYFHVWAVFLKICLIQKCRWGKLLESRHVRGREEDCSITLLICERNWLRIVALDKLLNIWRWAFRFCVRSVTHRNKIYRDPKQLCAVCKISAKEVIIWFPCSLRTQPTGRAHPSSLLPPPLSYLLPYLEPSSLGNRDHYCAGFRLWNVSWNLFGLGFPDLVSAPGGMPCHRGRLTRRPQGKL